jgi:formamidopyrimidine-DNA glycosylase
MPELPEVETIKRDLQNNLLGKRIVRVCVYNPMVVRQPSLAVFQRSLVGLTIKDVLRRGKLLILELSNGSALTIHLKMTGQLVLRQESSNLSGSKKSRVAFHLSGGKVLDFNDQRLFGELRLVDR